MKKLVLSAFLALAFAPGVFADDQKLQGKIVCAKCDLGIAEKCNAAVTVLGADGKPVTYLVEGDKAGEMHKKICKAGGNTEGTAEGTVSESGGAKHIKVTSYTVK